MSSQVRNDEGPLCRSCNEAIDCSTLNFSLKCLKKIENHRSDRCCLSNWNIQPVAQRQDDETESKNVHFDQEEFLISVVQ